MLPWSCGFGVSENNIFISIISSDYIRDYSFDFITSPPITLPARALASLRKLSF